VTNIWPQEFIWDADAMVMVPRSKAMACRTYVDGEAYRLDVVEERSINSHNHEFAWLHEAWKNLPETLADQYPTSEHLRKRALIDSGFYNETIIDCGTNAAALRVASHLRSRDGFALVIVRGAFVIERTAKSQSRRSMGKEEFQRSKTALMDTVAALIGTTPETLAANSGKAA